MGCYQMTMYNFMEEELTLFCFLTLFRNNDLFFLLSRENKHSIFRDLILFKRVPSHLTHHGIHGDQLVRFNCYYRTATTKGTLRAARLTAAVAAGSIRFTSMGRTNVYSQSSSC